MTEGAHIEIVDPKGGGKYPLVPSKVLVNGVDVGFVSTDGVQIKVGGSNEITEVTLTLLPSRVTIRGPEGAEFKRWGLINPTKDQESQ